MDLSEFSAETPEGKFVFLDKIEEEQVCFDLEVSIEHLDSSMQASIG